jgi:dTMP kinase
MTAPATRRGLFVVLEGGEGVGKTTQWEKLTAALHAVGLDVVPVREPGGTAAGDIIRRLLLDPQSTLSPQTESLLFAASRAQLVREIIDPGLAAGAVVLVDRFLLSTYAYQGAGRGVPLAGLTSVNAFATNGRAPDVTLLLSVPLDVALARMRARGPRDRMEREDHAFHTRVREAFALAVSPAWQAQHPEIGPVVEIDAHSDPDAVTARCLEAIVRRWPERFADAATALLDPHA